MMKQSDLIKWLFIILFIGLMFLLFGCNPVKQVLKSPDKTDQVVTEYRKRNPAKNDTTFIPGDTVITSHVIIDSVPTPYPVNHKYTERYYTDRIIRDTMKIIDRDLMQAVLNRLDSVEVKLTRITAERDEWKGLARQRLWMLISLITLILGGAVFWAIRTFQPKITLGK